MTDAQKLQALIQRAIEGEWSEDRHFGRIDKGTKFYDYYPEDKCVSLRLDEYRTCDIQLAELLFNHSFAKALFGEETITVARAKRDVKPGFVTTDDVYEPYPIECFKYHLQQAVIAESAIDYMYQAAFGDAVVK